MTDDLVERVARVICETENGPCKCMPDECGCTYWRAHARAAIAVALEEAAKVCDEAEMRERQAAKEPCDAEELAAFQRGAFMSRINAAAIRALKGTK